MIFCKKWIDKTHDLQRQLADEKRDCLSYMQKYSALLLQHNTLVSRINRLGGEAFLRTGRPPGQDVPKQFTKDELNTLVSLCHPDKHGGKDSAVRLTQKLLRMRR